jgi:predicted dithiol-disulfide oxidoreductase (DUF899 family)
MNAPNIVSSTQWLAARKALLAREKELTRLRDEVSRQRRALPWVKVETAYGFEGPAGRMSLADLFDGCGQLIVYHFMFGPDWKEGCKMCSFWADHFDGMRAHLRQRDANLIAISAGRLDQLNAFKARMGWKFPWVSSHGTSFNRDFHVSFTEEELAGGAVDYNYEKRGFPSTEAPGVSVFRKDAAGAVFHTYSCYSRGLDMLNGSYHMLDLLPKGRDEDGLPFSMAWVRHRDRYV